MKLIRFGNQGEEKPGVLIDGVRRDCSQHFHDWDRSFFQHDGLKKLQTILNDSTELPKVNELERWGACVARPAMILCVGLNYSDHAAESGLQIPKEPVLFMKATNTLAGPYDDVPIPKGSTKTDWEVELGLVLGKDVLYLESEKEAEEAIAGYCVFHDLSEREFQIERSGQWVKGKSCPGFSPVGPYLLIREAMPDAGNLQMKLSVNGEERQNGNTNTMVFDPAFIVHYVSQFMKLEAGDIITTGTPPGVGLGMDPPTYLKPGDIVELSIEQLGSQKQQFI